MSERATRVLVKQDSSSSSSLDPDGRLKNLKKAKKAVPVTLVGNQLLYTSPYISALQVADGFDVE